MPELSLRVSIKARQPVTQELLEGVGCTIAAKHPNEGRWQVLVFSDYEAAKHYAGAKSREEEPPAYLGLCFSYDSNENVSCTLKREES